MSQSLIQSQINKGYGIAARVLGAPYQHYRPVSGDDPIVQQNLIDVLDADFDLDAKFGYDKPTIWGKESYYGLVDLTTLQTGDYLIGPRGTFFVSVIEPLKPALCVFCTNLLSVYRPPAEATYGDNFYGGMQRSSANQLISNWPGTVLRLGSRVMRGAVDLPADPHMPWWELFLPAIPNEHITTADLVIDDNGRTYNISSVEETQLGIRLAGVQATS